jgi:hypothetical protein
MEVCPAQQVREHHLDGYRRFPFYHRGVTSAFSGDVGMGCSYALAITIACATMAIEPYVAPLLGHKGTTPPTPCCRSRGNDAMRERRHDTDGKRNAVA